MFITAVIVAGGKGVRFGANGPKQFIPIAGKPLLAWTLEAFASAVDAVCVVVPEQHRSYVKGMLEEHPCAVELAVCTGGKERVDSVRAGVCAMPEQTDVVCIHDGARPLVSSALINDVCQAAATTGAALAALPARDTIKLGANGIVSTTVERDTVHLAQTPQAFRADVMRRAFSHWDKLNCPPVTDDVQLVELLGEPVALVAGMVENIKVTVPVDFLIAELLLNRRARSEVL